MRLKDIQILTGHLGPIYTCHFVRFLWSDSYFCIIYIPTASDFRSGGNKIAIKARTVWRYGEIKIFNRIQEKVLFVWSHEVKVTERYHVVRVVWRDIQNDRCTKQTTAFTTRDHRPGPDNYETENRHKHTLKAQRHKHTMTCTFS